MGTRVRPGPPGVSGPVPAQERHHAPDDLPVILEAVLVEPGRLAGVVARHGVLRRPVDDRRRELDDDPVDPGARVRALDDPEEPVDPYLEAGLLDRKSTRLNSSHRT